MVLRTAGEGTGANGGNSAIVVCYAGIEEMQTLRESEERKEVQLTINGRKTDQRVSAALQLHLVPELGLVINVPTRLAPDNRSAKIFIALNLFASLHTILPSAIITLPSHAVQVLIAIFLLSKSQDVFPEAREGFRRGPCTCTLSIRNRRIRNAL